ncbi:MAG: calcium/sodium antiporter [Hyphomicrobiaceae bacterium]
MESWLWLFAGLALLLAGGEILVRGAVATARNLGVSPILIGITLVGFGTSVPEMVASIQATWAGIPGLAIGNIVGSNIANILLILGLTAAIAPISVAAGTLGRDGLSVLAATLLFMGLSLTTPLTVLVGFLLLALLVLYLVAVTVHEARSNAPEYESAYAPANGTKPGAALRILGSFALTIAGIAVVVTGGDFTVDSAVEIAQTYKISDAVIGLTIVAIGTSLPELATSLIAAFRNQADVAVGNILGSNMFNILGIGGLTAAIAPLPVAIPLQIQSFDMYVMLAATIALIAFRWQFGRVGRLVGLMWFLAYCGYLGVLAMPVLTGGA